VTNDMGKINGQNHGGRTFVFAIIDFANHIL